MIIGIPHAGLECGCRWIFPPARILSAVSSVGEYSGISTSAPRTTRILRNFNPGIGLVNPTGSNGLYGLNPVGLGSGVSGISTGLVGDGSVHGVGSGVITGTGGGII